MNTFESTVISSLSINEDVFGVRIDSRIPTHQVFANHEYAMINILHTLSNQIRMKKQTLITITKALNEDEAFND